MTQNSEAGLATDDSLNLPLIVHPAMMGGFTLPGTSGIAATIWMGLLPRIFGCIGDPPGLLRVEEAPAELADEALKMALVRRNDPKGCVHHSDSKNVSLEQ